MASYVHDVFVIATVLLGINLGFDVDYFRRLYDRWYAQFSAVFTEHNKSVESDTLTKMLFKLMIIAVASALLLFAVDVFLVSQASEFSGVFGDFFGGVLNPIFTFLTFLGLIVTIVIQRQELKLSRVEYEKTAEALTTQSVENTFFNMLDLHHKLTENLKFDLASLTENKYLKKAKQLSPDGSELDLNLEGRAVFDAVLKHLSASAASPSQTKSRYQAIQDGHNHVLGHYFRNLYQAMKFIDGFDDSVVSRSRKLKYASILRAQLSTKELALLFVNCLEGVCDRGQFKNLVIKYSMLEHLPVKKFDSHFQIGGEGRGTLRVDKAMMLQYRREKKLPIIDLVKTYGGAFGKNTGVPYDLARVHLEDG